MDASSFIYYWITFAVLVPVFSAVVLFLGWKAGYLKDQDRLRYLALWAEVPEEDTKHVEPRRKQELECNHRSPDTAGRHTDEHR